jgi:hypothetical protein
MENTMKRNLFTLGSIFLLTMCVGQTPVNAKLVKMGKHSEASVKSACDKAGGTFTSSSDTDGNFYACTKSNCDGKGFNCTVVCDTNGKKNCQGSVPSRPVPGFDIFPTRPRNDVGQGKNERPRNEPQGTGGNNPDGGAGPLL